MKKKADYYVNSLLIISIISSFMIFKAYGIEGTALILNEGAVILFDMVDGEEKVLTTTGIDDKQYSRFSPDGRNVATTYRRGIRIFPIDGSDYRDIESSISVPSRCALHWYENYIYWAGGTKLYRINVDNEEVEVVSEQPIDIPRFTHFTRDASIGYYHLRFDFAGQKPPIHFVKHCSPGISPSGTFITRNRGGHSCIVMHYRDTLENCCPNNCVEEDYKSFGVIKVCEHNPCVKNSFYDTIHVPGVWHARWVTAPHAGENWLTARKGYSGIDTSFIVNAEKKEYYIVDRTGKLVDFWPGPLPTSDDPVISINKITVTFSPAQTDPQVVTVTNNGGGTLGDLTIEEDASWLTIGVQGTGNTQELVNSVTFDGLTEESYSTTVTVSGGDAANKKTYTVVLSTGSTIPAPTDLVADAVGGPIVKLSWSDNAAGETGYAIERSSATEDWQEITVTDSNATTYRDTGRADGVSYSYRIRTVKGSDYSEYAGPVSVDVPLYPVITIESPQGNDTWEIGTTAQVKWSARNCDNVDIIFSMNGGRTWGFRPTGEDIGSVKRGDSLWGDVSFTVPDEETQECYVQVLDYNDPSYNTKVGPISIVPNTGVHNRINSIKASLHFNGSVQILHRGKNAYTFQAPTGAVIGIYRIDGSHVVDISVTGKKKVNSAIWDGRNRHGRNVVPGCYIARIGKK